MRNSPEDVHGGHCERARARVQKSAVDTGELPAKARVCEEKLKRQDERSLGEGVLEGVLEGVGRALPPLVRALRALVRALLRVGRAEGLEGDAQL